MPARAGSRQTTAVRMALLAGVTRLQDTVKPVPGMLHPAGDQFLVAYLAAALTTSWADPILSFVAYFQKTQRFEDTRQDFDLAVQLILWQAGNIQSDTTATAGFKLKRLACLLVYPFFLISIKNAFLIQVHLQKKQNLGDMAAELVCACPKSRMDRY